MKTYSVATLLALASTISAEPWPVKRASFAPDLHSDAPASFDCDMRKLAYQYGKQQIPRKKDFQSLWYALDLNSPTCTTPLDGTTSPESTPNTEIPVKELPTISIQDAVLVLPGESIQDAIDLACGATAATATATAAAHPTVLLRQGTHYLLEQLVITAKHNGLTLASYPGEEATVSGGKVLNVQWTSYDTKGDSNIWVADVQEQQIIGLQLNGKRATRARYPNIPGGIETSCGYGCMIPSANATWTPPNFAKNNTIDFYTDEIPLHDRNDTANDWFHHYMIGVDGLCSVYDPPVSYWCSQNPSGGGAFAFRTPSGVTPVSVAALGPRPWFSE